MNIAQMKALLEKRSNELKENKARLDDITKEVRGLKDDDAGMARLRELNTEVDTLESRQSELDLEVKALNDQIEREERTQVVRSGKADLQPIEGVSVRSGKAFEDMTFEQVIATEEYRSAWLRSIAIGEKGKPLFGEMNEAEKRAFIFTTANSEAVVPVITQNRIIDRLRHEAPMLEDATLTAISEAFAIPVRTEIAAGDAAIVAEDGANEDEQDTFALIQMPGVDIKKHAIMTRRMKFQSIDAFEAWLVEDISKRIMVAKEKTIIARLDGEAPATGASAITEIAIDSNNVLTDEAYDDATIRKIMGLIDEAGQVIVYANRYTIFNGLAGIKDGAGHKAFINTPQEDPTVKGIIYGAQVKEDVNLEDNVAYFGVKGAIKANGFAPLEIFPTVEARTANTIFTGTEIFDAGLENPKAFVKVSFATE